MNVRVTMGTGYGMERHTWLPNISCHVHHDSKLTVNKSYAMITGFQGGEVCSLSLVTEFLVFIWVQGQQRGSCLKAFIAIVCNLLLSSLLTAASVQHRMWSLHATEIYFSQFRGWKFIFHSLEADMSKIQKSTF